MTLGETLVKIWEQVLVEEKPVIELEGRRYSVETTRSKKLRSVEFDYDSYRITGIEQNPETNSAWAELARQGKRVMQFSCGRRYVGNVCEGKLLRYPAWHALELPE